MSRTGWSEHRTRSQNPITTRECVSAWARMGTTRTVPYVVRDLNYFMLISNPLTEAISDRSDPLHQALTVSRVRTPNPHARPHLSYHPRGRPCANGGVIPSAGSAPGRGISSISCPLALARTDGVQLLTAPCCHAGCLICSQRARLIYLRCKIQNSKTIPSNKNLMYME